ncbi:MAG: hypothetical protein Q9169_004202, partial [Polycauliona sp. 2 TL-2023]
MENEHTHPLNQKFFLASEKRTTKIAVPFGADDYSPNFSISGNQSSLVKRDADFDLLVCTGARLLDMVLRAPSANNPWVQQDLLQNGWTKKENVAAQTPEELDFVMDSMGISRDPADVKPAYWNQDRVFVDADGNADTPPTGGYYHNFMLPTSGAIIAAENYSPRFKQPLGPIPPLNRWSDIIWLSWLASGGNGRNLILILRSNIITQSTRDVLEFIHGADQDNLQLPWPGRAYSTLTTREGKALLATSHGRGVAWLLADHGDVLGRRVPVARVFT